MTQVLEFAVGNLEEAAAKAAVSSHVRFLKDERTRGDPRGKDSFAVIAGIGFRVSVSFTYCFLVGDKGI